MSDEKYRRRATRQWPILCAQSENSGVHPFGTTPSIISAMRPTRHASERTNASNLNGMAVFCHFVATYD